MPCTRPAARRSLRWARPFRVSSSTGRWTAPVWLKLSGGAEARGVTLAVLDIPLLYETGGDAAVDAVVVVTADAAIQRQRVLARPGMTAERLEAILARQLPDAEKRRRADFVVDTGHGLEPARVRVEEIVGTVLDPDWMPPRRGLPDGDEPPH